LLAFAYWNSSKNRKVNFARPIRLCRIVHFRLAKEETWCVLTFVKYSAIKESGTGEEGKPLVKRRFYKLREG
jgi:hypothetical protein